MMKPLACLWKQEDLHRAAVPRRRGSAGLVSEGAVDSDNNVYESQRRKVPTHRGSMGFVHAQ